MTADPIDIEPMTPADLPRVLAIERASFSSPWTEDNFRHELESNPLAWNVVAREGRAVVGFACAYCVDDELMINDVAVDPARRRGGIGRALLRYLLHAAQVRGCRRATLEVRTSNAAARSLYESLGFAIVGLRRGYYRDSGEDALLMDRAL